MVILATLSTLGCQFASFAEFGLVYKDISKHNDYKLDY